MGSSGKPAAGTGFSLGSDNHSGVHPTILAAVVAANGGHVPAYGMDDLSQAAVATLCRRFGASSAHLVFNGTAANVLALGALVPSHGSILCADSAHIHNDECAAPERALGCKLQAVPTADGKLTPAMLEPLLWRRGDQHVAQPTVISISQPTEWGTLYSLDELRELVAFARRQRLRVHVDGARLVNAAAALAVDLAALGGELGIDALSLGGTKNGLMGGEAVLLFDPALGGELRYRRKQHMQLGSKMRFVAAQFLAWLADDLWREMALHANAMAARLGQAAARLPQVQMRQRVQSNAIFARLPPAWLAPLRAQAFFYLWHAPSHEVRWMTSFDTPVTAIDAFVARLQGLAADADAA